MFTSLCLDRYGTACTLNATNANLGGDPCVGEQKKLSVKYRWAGGHMPCCTPLIAGLCSLLAHRTYPLAALCLTLLAPLLLLQMHLARR